MKAVFPEEFILESDCLNRKDSFHIRERNYEEAEREKVDLEEKQRADKRLREGAIKK